MFEPALIIYNDFLLQLFTTKSHAYNAGPLYRWAANMMRELDTKEAKILYPFFWEKKGKKEQGLLYVKRPNKFRWDYTTPKQKYFVYNGVKAYFYIVEDAQVIVDKNFSKNKLSQSISFLWGDGKLNTSFKIKNC